MPATKNGVKNSASQQTFGPSYFDRALRNSIQSLEKFLNIKLAILESFVIVWKRNGILLQKM